MNTGSWIHPSVTVKPAGGKGRGYFAVKPISKGEICLVSAGRIVANTDLADPKYAQVYDEYCMQIDFGVHLCPFHSDKKRVDGIFLTNHSCDPTCGIHGQISLIAMRHISPGVEITFDYAMTDANYEGLESLPAVPMRCLCGFETCRKIITDSDWKIPELQRRYKGYFSRYIQDMIDRNTASLVRYRNG